jgi:NADPH:quinone reductase-like Zn-dependent oxidoreductase
MQAVTFASAGADPKVAEEPIPTPGPGQVLVKTLYSAMNPIDIFSATTGLLVVGWPFTLGADGAGIITKVGSDVPAQFEVGTTVFGCTRLGVRIPFPFPSCFPLLQYMLSGQYTTEPQL